MEKVGAVALEAENLDPCAGKALDSLGLGLSQKGCWGMFPVTGCSSDSRNSSLPLTSCQGHQVRNQTRVQFNNLEVLTSAS